MNNKQWQNSLVEHRHGGNGWVVVQELGDDYYKVGMLSDNGLGSQFFLAYGPMLKQETFNVAPQGLPEKREPRIIPQDVMPKVEEIRSKLKAGTHKIVDTRLVPA